MLSTLLTLLLQEFSEYYRRGALPGGQQVQRGDSAAQSDDSGVAEAVVSAAAEPPTWVSFSEVRRLLDLGAYSIDEVVAEFARRSDRAGRLTRSAFFDALQELCALSQLSSRYALQFCAGCAATT